MFVKIYVFPLIADKASFSCRMLPLTCHQPLLSLTLAPAVLSLKVGLHLRHGQVLMEHCMKLAPASALAPATAPALVLSHAKLCCNANWI